MRILVDGAIFNMQAGGITRMYSQLLPALCDVDPTLHIDLYVAKTYRLALPQHPRIQYRYLLRGDMRPDRVFRHLRPWINRVIMMATAPRDAIWHSTYNTLPPVRMRATVATVYDLIFERYPEFYNGPVERRVRERIRRDATTADIVACISQTTAQDVIDMFGVPAHRVRAIPLAVDARFRPLQADELRMPPPTPRPFLLYVGARRPHKNFDGFLSAYSQWSQRDTVDVVVAGRPWSASERQRLDELGVTGRVVLQPDADDRVLRHLYNQAAAFVFPSLWEGFGLPLLEALACGCPVVASRIPSTVEVAGELPVTFELGDVAGFHAALDRALAEGRAAPRVVAGLDAAKRYTWEATARAFLDIYREVSAAR